MSENDNNGLGGLFDLSFEKFITPSVVKIVYILVIALAGLFWLLAIIAGVSSNGLAGFLGGLIIGGLGFLVSILVYRIFLELTMILFRIHENTDTIANR